MSRWGRLSHPSLHGHVEIPVARIVADVNKHLDTPAARAQAEALEAALRKRGLLKKGSGKGLFGKMAENVTLHALHDYARFVADVMGTINARIGRLMDDYDAIRTTGKLPAGRLDARVKDLEGLKAEVGRMRTLEQYVKENFGDPSSPKAKALRDEIAGLLEGTGKKKKAAPPKAPKGGIGAPKPGSTLDKMLKTKSKGWRTRYAGKLLDEFGGDARKAIEHILAAGTGADVREALIAVLKRLRLISGKRLRAGNAKFMRQMLAIIAADPKHPLRFLIKVKGKKAKWRGTRHASRTDPAVQAGHGESFHSGAPERLGLEDADFNQWSNWTGESKGAIFDKPMVEIGGVPVEKRTALMWEDMGLLPKGTVAKSPPTTGWTP